MRAESDIIIPGRILEISRDPLFKSVYPDRTSWVQTGRPLEPYGRYAGHPDIARISVAQAFAALAARRYDFAVFPALRPWGPGDRRQPLRARVRRLLISLTRVGIAPALVEAVFGLRRIPYIIRDPSDIPDIDDPGLALLRRGVLYSKREVLETDLGPGSGRPPVVYTPMPFELSIYDGFSHIEKSVDVFYAARPNSPLRAQAMEVVRGLAQEGYEVDVPQDRVVFNEFLERMARARLVVSPRGNGEHCWRHYEALLLGSVPVINVPLRRVHYELQHGESALFYEPTAAGLRDQILQGLSDPSRLGEIARNGAELIRSRHSKPEVCRLLLRQAGFVRSMSPEA